MSVRSDTEAAVPHCGTLYGMSMVIWHITMSLDGFIAGPNDTMDWAVREWSDEEPTRDIEVDRSPIAERVMGSAGAILGGRRWYDAAERLYDGVDGIYGGQWRGPVFVLTNRPPDEVGPKVGEVPVSAARRSRRDRAYRSRG